MAMAKVRERLVEEKLTLFEVKEKFIILHPSAARLLATSARSLERRALERGHLSICHVRAVCVSARLLGNMHVSAKQDSAMVYRYMYVVTHH